jgi:hypothetical protein
MAQATQTLTTSRDLYQSVSAMRQYGLSAAVAARVLAGVERELRTSPGSVTKRSLPRRELLPPHHNSCAPPKKLGLKIWLSDSEVTEVLKQLPWLERWIHGIAGLIIG